MKTLLIDNGSKRPAAVRNLRRIARALSERTGIAVDAVPLQHADLIPAAALDGEPARIFVDYMDAALADGCREFQILPLFFGASRALSAFIPEQIELLQARHGAFVWRVGEVLCPLPAGEPRLAAILYDNVFAATAERLDGIDTVVLVDHGSPVARVTAVRNRLAELMRAYLPPTLPLLECVMERREGPDYDFNGPLLQDSLDALASAGTVTRVVLAMLFLSPGRHAGEGGDIADIAAAAMRSHPGFEVLVAPLVGEHPGLIELLAQRLHKLAADAPSATRIGVEPRD
ncbi:MAG: sirohydrochlorin chelatase [Thiotrichales bacterium]